MEILVLLKQVPSTEALIEVADDGVSIKTEGLRFVINPYDELAVEEALRIREAQGGTVTIVSVGPAKAAEAIRTGLAMGADKGILVNPGDLNCDGLAVAKILAAAIKPLSYDLIIAGHRAVDDDNFQTATAVAELLGIANVSMVIKQELLDGKIRCQCTVEGGTKTVDAPLPALIAAQRGLNKPRFTSMSGIMKAKKKPLETKSLADVGIDIDGLQPLVQVKALRLPEERSGGRIIEGDSVQAKVSELARLLREEAKVI
ncbi:MAG: electron transfer flavoprotein subunit beta/FixA family protein [Desulfatitalea sp.]|nr:electron transfer flavoprotein subunit beta/FixA family protein [Desulfatitalea sp.]NNK01248.1 electron transfer flavoprotein subunit beta/FixA family protein [Desulfatitalea sp.]